MSTHQAAQPADFFTYAPDPGPNGTARVDRFAELAGRMAVRDGARAFRMTITPAWHAPGYPPGLWVEGWRDPAPCKLAFGAALEQGGPIFPAPSLAREAVAA